MVKPFRPEDVKKELVIPDVVIEAVNFLLCREFDGKRARILQRDVLNKIAESPGAWSRAEIFERKALDFEPIYRDAGWSVTYDKPGYNETYEPFWIFERII